MLVRLSAFLAAFVLPFAVAALPLLSVVLAGNASSDTDDTLALSVVPVESISPDPNALSAPLAYGSSDAYSSLDCAGESIVAIEG
jgi:hypothetical protein